MAGLLGRLARTLIPKTGAAGELIAGEVQPIFYSALEDAIRTSPTKVAPGAQWLATLKKTPGVKAQEVEWSGIERWLGNRADLPLKREDLDWYMQNEGKKKYDIGEEFMSKEKSQSLSDDEWNAKYRSKVGDREGYYARSAWRNQYVEPRIDVEEVRGNRTPEQILKDLEQRRVENERALNRPDEYAHMFVGDQLHRDSIENVTRLEEELARSQRMYARDTNTRDLFTGELTPMPYGQDVGWRVRMTNPETGDSNVLEELFPDEHLAWDAGVDRRRDLYNESRDSFVQRAKEEGDYYDRAYEDILSDYPRQQVIRPAQTYYHGYAVPGGTNYDELVLTLPDEFRGMEGMPETHWTQGRKLGEDQPPDFAHSRFKDRQAPEYDPEELSVYKQKKAEHSAAADARREEMQRLQNENYKISDMLIDRIYAIDRQRSNAGLPDVDTLSYEQKQLIYNSDLEMRDLRAIRESNADRMREISEATSQAGPGPELPEPIRMKRVLAVDETQSDPHQEARKRGYRKPSDKWLDLDTKAVNARAEATRIKMDLLPQIAEVPQLFPYVSDALRYMRGGQWNDNDEIASILRGERVPRLGADYDERLLREDVSHRLNDFLERAVENWTALSSAPGTPKDAPIFQILEKAKALNSKAKAAESVAKKAEIAASGARSGVTDMPFQNNTWATIMLKRLLRKAADEDYDEVAWSGKIKNGSWIEEGQKGGDFYDVNLVNEANALAKKFGIQVQQGAVPIRDNPDAIWNTLKITPEFREFIKKGLPLFMWPLFAGGAASTGLLGRGRPKKEEA